MRDSDQVGMREVDQLVRQLVFRHFVDDACPPGTREIAREAGLSASEATDALRRVAQPGVISLAPGSERIWMAHPFSAILSSHAVTCGNQRYWANCAMDALAVAILVDADGDVDSVCSDCGEHMRFEVRSGALHGDGVVHVLLPPSHWFDNIAYTCQTTLFFANEEHVRRWCNRHQVTVGGIAPVCALFEATKHLVGPRAGRDFTQADQARRSQIFADAGLSDEFWLTIRQKPLQTVDVPAGSRSDAVARAIERARLSDRELEVLSRLAAAESQKQIAHALSLSIHTVDTHIRNIYAKLGARSRAAAVATALRAGIV